jgi:hypothetical protein
MAQSVNAQLQDTSTDVAASSNSSEVQADRIEMLDVTAVVAGNNPAVSTFVDGDVSVANDTVTETAHGYTTGVKIALTTDGVLPTGLSATDYFLSVVDEDTYGFSTSQANATAGTLVDITAAAGGGTHTVTPNTTLAGTIKLQKNNNPPHLTAEWVDLLDGEIQGAGTASNTISAAATFNWSVPHFAARSLRAVTTITSGTVTVDARVHGKGS